MKRVFNILFYLAFGFIAGCTNQPIATVQSESVPSREITSLLCKQLFANSTEREIDYVEFYRKYKDQIETANSILMVDIVKRSVSLEKKLRANQLSEYDFIFVGAGIHTGVVMSQIKETLPNARILILEKSSEHLSVFGRTGETFSGNTLESEQPGTIHKQASKEIKEQLKASSRNVIPNAPIQTYDIAKGKIPRASDFAAPVIATYSKYKPDILFGVDVLPIIPDQKSKNGGFILDLPRGMGQVKGKLGGIGIGLGQANVPVKTEKGMQLVIEGQSAAFIEDVLHDAQKAKNDPQQRDDFIKKFKDKDVALLGGGHGSAIVIDLLMGFAPPEFYAKFPLADFKPRSITWVGLKDPQGGAVNGESFKQFIGGGTRYHHLAELIDNGQIRVVSQNAFIEPGQEKKVGLYFWNKGASQFDVNAQGQKQGIETDFVAYAAGYNFGPIDKMLSRFTKNLPYQSVIIKGDIQPNDIRMTSKNVGLGKVILDDQGNQTNLFLYGPSAGAIAEAADPGGAASPVINVMASRSQSMGSFLVKKFKEMDK